MTDIVGQTVETTSVEAVPGYNATAPNLVYAEAINGGLWTVYDDESLPLLDLTSADGEAQARGLERRCGSNSVGCDFANNRAIAGICGKLMDVMGAPENRDRLISQTLSSQCFTATNIQNNNRCCIAWSQRVGGIRSHYLFNAASTMLNRCTRNDLISAWATDVDLAGYCMTQCTSNRPDGCH
jgi:hypothetical protein